MTTIRVAFASSDRRRVDQHFGAARSFVVYDVASDRSTLVGVADFSSAAMDGNEDKLAARVDFLASELAGVGAVFVLAIGASAIKQLLARGIHPVRIDRYDAVDDLLDEIVLAINRGGVPWVERAIAAQARRGCKQRFARMAEEGWQGWQE